LKLVITQVTARDAAAQDDEAATGTNHQLPKQHVPRYKIADEAAHFCRYCCSCISCSCVLRWHTVVLVVLLPSFAAGLLSS
jgi:hypothetical protein